MKTKYGFIASEEAMALYGTDVFLLGNDMGSFQVGDAVTFEIVENEQGKPQGKFLEPDGFAGGFHPGHHSAPAGFGGSPGWTGVIKSFSDKTRYGFIDCPQA